MWIEAFGSTMNYVVCALVPAGAITVAARTSVPNRPPAEMLLGLLPGTVWIMCRTQGEYLARQWSASRIKKTLRRAVWIVGSTTALLLCTTGIQGAINLLRTASPKP